MLGGFLAWAVQFTVIYGVTSTVCARGWADTTVLGAGIVPFTVAGTTLVAAVAAAAFLVHALRKHRRLQSADASVTDVFLIQGAVLISAFSIAAILWHGLPALILPACS
ncbi:hypothetical protein [Microvirga lenta]|uniref:hypothetical protein n=1 Tax=Microvirga lenta TaxID=2881337 RepID=UPI001CFFCA30|nr:hypothetical protein [Microvirga lenta]MCB5175726.1 hypothetical protein [Microvirga lenta]